MFAYRVHPGIRIISFYILFCIVIPCHSQMLVGSKSNGLGGITLIPEDPFSTFNNPAAINHVSSLAAGVTHKQHYLLKQLSTSGLSFILPTKSGTIGTSYIRSGIPEMSHNFLTVAFARIFGERIFTGLAIHYVYLRSPETGEMLHTASFSSGISIKTGEKFEIGIYVFNPVPSSAWLRESMLIPTVYRLGFIYRANERLFLAAETEKSTDSPLNMKIGIEYGFPQLAFLRTGINLNPFTWSFGAGIKMHHFILDMAASIHPSLGITPELTLTYNI